ncbi:MAG: membrane protein [Alphaproteobacteria bacterium]|nr:MAG: membrane protein [Alphaproteobacteria bacterium]
MTSNVILLVARVLLSAIFIAAGVEKFGNIAGTAGYIASVGLPAPTALAWLSGIFETVTGIAILVGFMTRYAAWALAAFCAFTAVMFHAGPINISDFPAAANGMLTSMNQIMMMKNLALAGGFLVLSVAGAGAWSVDARRGAVPAHA